MLKSTMVHGDGEAPLDGCSGQTLNLDGLDCLVEENCLV